MKELLIFSLFVFSLSVKLMTFESALSKGAISDTKGHDILKILKLDKKSEDEDIREEDFLKHRSKIYLT
jgi:hypothetical protein